MLVSLLYKSSPEDVRMILVDPKMLELSVYDGIPHLLTPVITDMKDAANGLRWCVAEMERRYKLMSLLGVRNLAGYNRKVADALKAGEPIPDPTWKPDPLSMTPEEDQVHPSLEKLPSIVVVIDEFADMMMIVGKKVEELIARIAQKARAAGIHLILATQRPSVNVITGVIKANLPSRISFKVASKVDSRTILDGGGAEALIGKGDMLFIPPGTSNLVRAQGAFVSDDEINGIVDYLKENNEPPNFAEEIQNQIDSSDEEGSSSSSIGGEDGDDALLGGAIDVLRSTKRASTSMLQRRLRIGYNRAARLMEELEERGIVGPENGSSPREILVDLDVM